MKALSLKQLKTPLELEDRPELVPAANQVVVQLKAASVNRRDYWITQGMYPGIELPVVLGSDGAGVVAQCGDGVDSAWVGREVLINPGVNWGDVQAFQSDEFTILGLPADGTFATEVVVPVSQLAAKPAHLSWQQAAALPLAGVTAYRAMFSQGNLQAGEKVLITGIGGGVATFALQYAVAAGAQVWVTSSSQEKINRAVELGAQAGFNYRDETWSKQMKQQAGEPNLIIDSAGGAGYKSLLNLAAPGGRIVNYGATTGPPDKVDMFKLFWKQLHLIGSTMGSPADFARMLKFVEQKKIAPVIDSVRPLAEANAAIESMKSSTQFGKMVLEING
ncbi:MAG: alcohol dehydrogenase [Blastopirellula sp.]|nr:MAG: alcohol dehydrogenase [Blastopirellula sp.]